MKRGPKPRGTVKCVWSPELAYAIGLITADGCLSGDGRHIDLTSKDRVQVALFKKCLGISTKIGIKNSGAGNQAYHTQFGDVLFYRFLMDIGLMPAKSKRLASLAIPKPYILDFTRGLFDGDGCSYSFYDSAWKNSYRFYISFASASPLFIDWFRDALYGIVGVRGHIDRGKNRSHLNLKYSKREALVLTAALYYRPGLPRLMRKWRKIQRSLREIERNDARVTGGS